MIVEVLAVIIVLLILWDYSTKDPPGFPPGPRCYPIIGTADQVKNYDDLKRLRNKYGDVFRTRIGNAVMVVVCDYKLLREAFNKQELSDRPNWKFVHFLSDGKVAGVVFRSGPGWVTLRRFLLRHLRDLGMGKSRLDDVILREAGELVRDFRNHTHCPTLFPRSINAAVLNVIWQLVASKRYSLEDKQIRDFSDMVARFQDNIKHLILPDFFPWLNYLPKAIKNKISTNDVLLRDSQFGKALMEEIIDEHRASLDPENRRDLLDEYLIQMAATPQEDVLDSPFNEVDLLRTIFDLFTAGYDTTSNMLRWVMLYMAANPRIQDKVQEELDEVVPRDSLPSHQFRRRLPYLDATIHEILRVSSLVVAGVPHLTSQDVYIGGYFIPKDTVVAGYMLACHMDPKLWQDPEEFRPERFLDAEGKFVSPKEGFLPFGVGKRSCLGEALARMELYVFSAALLQSFTFAPAGPDTPVDLTPRDVQGQTLPRAQKLIIKCRESGKSEMRVD